MVQMYKGDNHNKMQKQGRYSPVFAFLGRDKRYIVGIMPRIIGLACTSITLVKLMTC